MKGIRRQSRKPSSRGDNDFTTIRGNGAEFPDAIVVFFRRRLACCRKACLITFLLCECDIREFKSLSESYEQPGIVSILWSATSHSTLSWFLHDSLTSTVQTEHIILVQSIKKDWPFSGFSHTDLFFLHNGILLSINIPRGKLTFLLFLLKTNVSKVFCIFLVFQNPHFPFFLNSTETNS
jgi:hypothetical protein